MTDDKTVPPLASGTCSNCPARHEIPGGLICRMEPPVAMRMPDGRVGAAFPPVQPTDGCAKHPLHQAILIHRIGALVRRIQTETDEPAPPPRLGQH